MNSVIVKSRLVLIYLVQIVLLELCRNQDMLDQSYVQHMMQKVLPEQWMIIEIKENHFLFSGIKEGSSGYKVTIEGKPEMLVYYDYGDDKGDYRSEEKMIAPRYVLWFMPAAFKEESDKKYKEIKEYESKLQTYHPFMHPTIIVETDDIIVFGIYETFGYETLTEPKVFNWQILRDNLINEMKK